MAFPLDAPGDRPAGQQAGRLVDFGPAGGMVPAPTMARAGGTGPPAQAIQPEALPHVRDYLGVLWRRKLTILAVTIVTLGLSLAAALLRQPYYQATSEVLLPEHSGQTVAGASAARSAIDPARVLATEVKVVEGPDVRAGVLAKLGQAPKVSVSALPDADVIRIQARSASASSAAALANAYANAYLDLRRKQASDAIVAASRDIQAEIDDLQIQIDKGGGPPQQALIQAQAVFRQNLGELRVNGVGDPARLLAAASVPGSPAGPKPLRSAVWGLLLGLVLGASVAFVRDYLDDSIKTKDDLEAAVPGLPVLGVIPTSGAGTGDTGRVVSITDPSAPATEAYRTLRTAIQFLDPDHPVRVLQITSPSTREGKSTVVANLGVEFAQAGQRVIIVCCDLRRPRIHEFFRLDNEIGLTSVIAGKVALADALTRVPGQPGIIVLPAGPLAPNPAELLSSKRAGQILTSLRSEADLVLLDCPPLLPVTDSLVVSAWADASLLVCYAGQTTRKAVARSIELLHQVGAPLSGTILNAAPANAVYGEAYGYYLPSTPSGN